MRLVRFKNQKIFTQGKGTPLSLDHHPMQPWPFKTWHKPSMLLMFSYSNLYLPFYKELGML